MFWNIAGRVGTENSMYLPTDYWVERTIWMSLLFSRYCILYSNTNIYFIFKYFFLCVCKYFFLNVDRSSFKTFQNPVLLTSQVLHPKNLYKLLLQIIQKNSRDTYVQMYKLSLEAYFSWMQTTAANLNPYTANPFHEPCVTFLRVYYSFHYFTTLTIFIFISISL